jgi:biopolymer transport protein ExbD
MFRRRKLNVPKQKSYLLQLTAMVDMFTILLVFLLASYSTSPYHITPHEDLSLPVSSTQQNAEESVKIILTREGLFVEDIEVAKLVELNFERADIDRNDPDFITPLFAQLELLGKKDDALEAFKNGQIILQADSQLSYSLLRKVMYTASMAGYPKLSMATISSH